MRTKIFSIIAAATAATFGAGAQNLEESVTVEGKYTPEIIPARRLPMLPAAASLTAPESRLEFDQRGVPASFAPDALPMAATGWRTSKKFNDSKGYVDFRLGSWLNSSLSAGAAAVNTADTKLDVTLQHNSTSLWQAWKGKDMQPDADRRFRYDENLDIALSHRVARAGTLAAKANYHLGYFNYYGTTTGTVRDGRVQAPTQTVNDVYAGVCWKGETTSPFSYSVRADARYFAYRSFYYLADVMSDITGRDKGGRETEINAGGDVAWRLTDNSKIGAEALYTGVINAFGNNVNRAMLTPAYTITRDNFSLRLGAQLAVVGAEKTRFRVAPDLRMTATGGIAAATISIGGGTHLRTLAWNHAMDYYADPMMMCTQAAYSPLDARVAFQLNPGGKWTLGVEGMWRTTLDETPGGIYQAILNREYQYLAKTSTRLHGFGIALNAGYNFCPQFALAGEARWQPQHGNTGVLDGFDRPAITARLSAKSKPIEKLGIALNYNLRAKRHLLKGNISRLDLTADYSVTDRISVGAEFNNLLNRHEELLPGLPTEGFNAAAGVQLTF